VVGTPTWIAVASLALRELGSRGAPHKLLSKLLSADLQGAGPSAVSIEEFDRSKIRLGLVGREGHGICGADHRH